MSLDKSYYDYDYTNDKPRKPIDTYIMSDDEVSQLLSGAMLPGTNELIFKETAEDLQKLAMEKK